MPHCLDLFAGLGGFSSAFEESPEWTVTTVDINDEFEPDICTDILELGPDDLPQADVILASPPCQDFSTACMGDKWDSDESRSPRYLPKWESVAMSVQIVYHTLWLIQELQPRFWFVENPVGMLRWIIGDPTGTVTYCQYGENYQKPTDLWGVHPGSMTYRTCRVGEPCHASNTETDGYSAIQSMPSDTGERAKVPHGLSKAILEAVEEPGAEQSTLTEVLG